MIILAKVINFFLIPNDFAILIKLHNFSTSTSTSSTSTSSTTSS